MNLAFFGSPYFALPTLELLKAQKDLQIVLVVTQPDRPAGRGLNFKPTAIKVRSAELGLPVLELMPSAEQLKALKVEKIVVVAYGQFIPPEIIFGWECINLHPSLLPKYRGPSPMESALLNGDTLTGITTMLVAKGMDDGDILLQQEIPIDINTNLAELAKTCSEAGAPLVLDTLRADLQKLKKKQDPSKVIICQKIKNEDGEIKPGESIFQIHNKVRAIGGFLEHKGKRIKILQTKIIENKLVIEQVQPEGKQPMSYNDYKNGYGEINL